MIVQQRGYGGMDYQKGESMKMHDRDRRTEYEIYLEDARRNEIKNPDPNNRDELVRSTLFWVVTLALRFHRKYPSSDLMDVIQAGNMGAIHAATKYKPSKGKFTTYATPWIAVYMARWHLATKRNIYIPPGSQIKMMARGDTIPQECSIDDTPPSYQPKESPDSEQGYANTIPDHRMTPEDQIVYESQIETCLSLILALPQSESRVLWKRLIEDKTLDEISVETKPRMCSKGEHVTKERIRQIERKALKKVRAAVSEG